MRETESFEAFVGFIATSSREFRGVDPLLLRDELLRQINNHNPSIGQASKSRIHLAFKDALHIDLFKSPLHDGDDMLLYRDEALECFEVQNSGEDVLAYLHSLRHDPRKYRGAIINLRDAIKELIDDGYKLATRKNVRAINAAFMSAYGEEIVSQDVFATIRST